MGNLESLPDEILYRICAFLSPRKAARIDIAKFSLVSKKCAIAAGRRRLERIIIISTASMLRQDVNELTNILSRSARFGRVRQVKIKDSASPKVITKSELVRGDRQTLEDEDSDADDDDDEDLCRLPRFRKHDTQLLHNNQIDMSLGNRSREASSGEAVDTNRRYWCLSVLLGKLRSLSDLVWDCAIHIPSCLLMSLEKKMSRGAAARSSFPTARWLYNCRRPCRAWSQQGRVGPGEIFVSAQRCMEEAGRSASREYEQGPKVHASRSGPEA